VRRPDGRRQLQRRLQDGGRQRLQPDRHLEALRRLAVILAALLLAPAAGAATPAERGLAGQLKSELQRYFKTKVPGTKLTTVTCKISADRASANCAAHFVRTARRLKGTYKVIVLGGAGGNAQWQITSVACTSTRTGAKVRCK
jgi:hypothetical protein